MKEILRCARDRSKARFLRATDSQRLVSLGIFLIVFGALGLLADFGLLPLPDYFGGEPALFGGAAIALVIVKLGRGDIYIDWIANGFSYAAAGFALHATHSSGFASSGLVSVLLLASASARVWIGLTVVPELAAKWILLSGIEGIAAAFCIFAGGLFCLPVSPQFVISFDCLYHGLSIVGFGLLSRETSSRH